MSIELYQSKTPKYAGHTAGPWRPSEDGKYVEQDREIQYTIASTWHDASVDNKDELDANAALIADAPYLACEVERLRELCGELVGALEEVMYAIDKEYGYRKANFPKARYALAKAKGGDE